MLVGSLLLGRGLKVRLSALPCGVSWDQCEGLGNAEHLLGKLAGVKPNWRCWDTVGLT